LPSADSLSRPGIWWPSTWFFPFSSPSLLNALGSKAGVDIIVQCFRNNIFLNTEGTYTAKETADKCMMEDVIKESVS
jgi:hypothetical protein